VTASYSPHFDIEFLLSPRLFLRFGGDVLTRCFLGSSPARGVFRPRFSSSWLGVEQVFSFLFLSFVASSLPSISGIGPCRRLRLLSPAAKGTNEVSFSRISVLRRFFVDLSVENRAVLGVREAVISSLFLRGVDIDHFSKAGFTDFELFPMIRCIEL